MNPFQTGQFIYEESLTSLMPDIIRAVVNRFIKRGVELDVKIIPDITNILMNQKTGLFSVLVTRFEARTHERENDRVYAKIFIHKDANRTLAKICIARDIYYLLLELDAFSMGGKRIWSGIRASKQIETECDQFAWELCRLNNSFYRNIDAQQKYVQFPEHLFDRPFATGIFDFAASNGIELDPKNPFHSMPPLES